MHSTHWHANTFLRQGHRGDAVNLIPGTVMSLSLEPRQPGTWLLHCHVNGHIHAGMMALYQVLPNATYQAPVLNGVTRRHYIAAEQVLWDYAPLGGDACTAPTSTNTIKSIEASTNGTPASEVAPFNEVALTFLANGTGMAGGRYLKALYVEYTDDTFTQKKARQASDAYQGLLGPVLRAEVGDTLQITFKNNLQGQSVSMHGHGVAYTKSSEGASYADSTSGNDVLDDAIAPGQTWVYNWTVPESSGPGPSDPSTQGWLYHSHLDEGADPYAGLVGALIIGRPGAFRTIANSTELGTAADVDSELVYLFSVFDEEQSFLWQANQALMAENSAPAPALAKAGRKMLAGAPGPAPALAPALALALAPGPEAAAAPSPSADSSMGDASVANMMHAINGYMYCNGPAATLRQGGTARFHAIALGTEVDLHTPNLEDESWTSLGERMPTLTLLAGAMSTADINVTAPLGPAVLQCRVADHISAGMQALVDVVASNGEASDDGAAANATTRQYFIRAEERAWNYAPLGDNNCDAGGEVPFTPEQALYAVKSTLPTLGATYTKALYMRYNDSSFTTRVAVPQYQGLLGPVLAADVGDVIEIVFQNALDFPVNLHIDGGFVPVPGSDDPRAEVAPGGNVTYRLYVPEA